MLNTVILVGRVSNEIDLRYTPSGSAVCTFSLVTERYYNKEKKPSFHNIKAWGKLAENTAQHSGKGRLLAIDGFLDYEKWEKDGQKHTKAVVVANNIRFLDWPKDKTSGEEWTPPQGEDDLPF